MRAEGCWNVHSSPLPAFARLAKKRVAQPGSQVLCGTATCRPTRVQPSVRCVGPKAVVEPTASGIFTRSCRSTAALVS